MAWREAARQEHQYIKQHPTTDIISKIFHRQKGAAFITFGEVTKSRPASAAASIRPKFDTGFTTDAARLLGFGAAGTELAGMDSTMGLPST